MLWWWTGPQPRILDMRIHPSIYYCQNAIFYIYYTLHALTSCHWCVLKDIRLFIAWRWSRFRDNSSSALLAEFLYLFVFSANYWRRFLNWLVVFIPLVLQRALRDTALFFLFFSFLFSGTLLVYKLYKCIRQRLPLQFFFMCWAATISCQTF